MVAKTIIAPLKDLSDNCFNLFMSDALRFVNVQLSQNHKMVDKIKLMIDEHLASEISVRLLKRPDDAVFARLFRW